MRKKVQTIREARDLYMAGVMDDLGGNALYNCKLSFNAGAHVALAAVSRHVPVNVMAAVLRDIREMDTELLVQAVQDHNQRN